MRVPDAEHKAHVVPTHTVGVSYVEDLTLQAGTDPRLKVGTVLFGVTGMLVGTGSRQR